MIELKKKRVCKCCKKMFIRHRSTQVVCSYECSIELTKIKQKEKEAKEWKVAKAKMKENLKTLGDYEKAARIVFQKWIRERDKDLPCISCGQWSNRFDAGHYFEAGVYSGLIFHEDNVHKQCSFNCNKNKHGNLPNYRIGLINKIGEERVKWLEENKDRLKNYTYTKDELLQITTKYKQLLTNKNKSNEK
jgi:hypothetical protein